MKQIHVVIMIALMLVGTVHAGTISYSYDEQNRLSGVNYNNQASVSYRYDKASNMTKHEILTQSQYLKPFLLYFGAMHVAPGIQGVAFNAQYNHLLLRCMGCA